MGDHEAKPIQNWAARIGRDVLYRAKAWVSAIVVLVAGELVVALADPAVTAQLDTIVPAWALPYLPVLISAVSFALTHAVPNGPKPGAETPVEE